VFTSFYKQVLLLLVLAGAVLSASAQIQSVSIGVNGLTCSQCSRTVEMSLRKLPFVEDVQMNLEHTVGRIVIKKGSKADMDQVAKAVTNAGFSLRYLQADVAFNSQATVSGTCMSLAGDEYVFSTPPAEPLKGMITLKFLDRNFLPKNDFKKIQASLNNPCGAATGKVYHISYVKHWVN
jgi:copper chaperone CopZ